MEDPRLVSAYVAFYLTTNIPKFEAVLRWMPPGWLRDLERSDLIDLGAGPGTFSIAFAEWCGPLRSGDVFQIEKSKLMREQAKKIWAGLYPDKGAAFLEHWNEKNEKEKFLLFGHSANEMGPYEAVRYIEKINPDHILFLEPGTKDFFPQMLEIRQVLLRAGYNILFPCPNGLDCPMAASESDWCHQFIQVAQSADVERLSQMAKKDRRLLPLTVHAFSRKRYEKTPAERLVRVLPETKFSFEWEVCVENRLKKYQLMKRPYDKSEQKSLSQVLAGASLETEVEKETEQSTRVRLLKLNK
jgi:ribosomal protein RSM22 (predicted rRNA methylase)